MWTKAAAWCAAAMAAVWLVGCPGPGARPGPDNPFSATPAPGRPPGPAKDPAVGITRVAATVPGAGHLQREETAAPMVN